MNTSSNCNNVATLSINGPGPSQYKWAGCCYLFHVIHVNFILLLLVNRSNEEDFDLNVLMLTSGKLLLIHFDNPTNAETKPMLDLLSATNHKQNVAEPTHKSGSYESDQIWPPVPCIKLKMQCYTALFTLLINTVNWLFQWLWCICWFCENVLPFCYMLGCLCEHFLILFLILRRTPH